MADVSKLRIALCQVEDVQGHPSAYEMASRGIVARAKATGANLVVLGGRRPRLVALNGAVLAQEESRATLAVGDDVFHIAIDAEGRGAWHGEDCDIFVTSDNRPWTMAGNRDARSAGPAGGGPAIVYANPVGIAQAGKRVVAFDGGSSAWSPDGQLLCRLRDDFTGDYAPFTLMGPGPAAQPCDMKLLRALVSTIRRFDAQVMPWQPKWVIGLSGGLDSSVVAALLVMALGPDRVIGYNLATRYNSAATKGNAADTARALGMELRNGSIEKLVQATGSTLTGYGYPEDAMTGLVLENVQARVRGHMLSTFAAVESGVVVNNGNRVEAALGYATLYGDAIGALAPIGDVTKVQLFGLAREINEVFGCEAVPSNLLPSETEEGFEWQVMPSAELADGQHDPMKWFYHDWLVCELLDETAGDACPIMERYLEDGLESAQVGKWVRYYGLDDPAAFIADLEWVCGQMRSSAFKRIQSPPSIRVASPASVRPAEEVQGASEPSERYVELRRRVLEMPRSF